jgi:hypothetical protein
MLQIYPFDHKLYGGVERDKAYNFNGELLPFDLIQQQIKSYKQTAIIYQ